MSDDRNIEHRTMRVRQVQRTQPGWIIVTAANTSAFEGSSQETASVTYMTSSYKAPRVGGQVQVTIEIMR